MHLRSSHLFLLTQAAFFLCTSLGLSTEPLGKNEGASNDIVIGQKVKKALVADEVFRNLNIGFTVENGTVKLWGDVPDKGLIARAGEIVKRVRGVNQVVNECKFSAAEDDFPRMVAEAVKQREGITQQPVVVSPKPEDPLAVAPLFVARKVAGKPEEAASPKAVLLLPPVTTTFKPAYTAPDEDLPTALERIRLSDPRFAQTKLDLKRGWVTIQGTVAADADARALGEKLSDLPGVEQVIIKAQRK